MGAVDCEHMVDDVCTKYAWVGKVHDKIFCAVCKRRGGMDGRVEQCVHIGITPERPLGRPCKGRYIVCNNPKNPMRGVELVLTERVCCKSRCRFYEGSK
jgi:hypothetical protein